MLEAVPGPQGINPYYLTPVGGTLYFVGYNAAAGYDSLWRYTGGRRAGADPRPDLPLPRRPGRGRRQPGVRRPGQRRGLRPRSVQVRRRQLHQADRHPQRQHQSQRTHLVRRQAGVRRPGRPDGSTTESGRVGRELWQVNLDRALQPVGAGQYRPAGSWTRPASGTGRSSATNWSAACCVPIFDLVEVTDPGQRQGLVPRTP